VFVDVCSVRHQSGFTYDGAREAVEANITAETFENALTKMASLYVSTNGEIKTNKTKQTKKKKKDKQSQGTTATHRPLHRWVATDVAFLPTRIRPEHCVRVDSSWKIVFSATHRQRRAHRLPPHSAQQSWPSGGAGANQLHRVFSTRRTQGLYVSTLSVATTVRPSELVICPPKT